VFLRTVVDEVVPAVAARYDVHDARRGLAGFSFGGLFALFTLPPRCTASDCSRLSLSSVTNAAAGRPLSESDSAGFSATRDSAPPALLGWCREDLGWDGGQ